MAMICRMYGYPNLKKFKITWVPLLYFFTDIDSTFNWEDMLSLALEEALTTMKNTALGEFLSFNMPSYILDVMYICHSYPHMGWTW
jgi:hypothetical protein